MGTSIPLNNKALVDFGPQPPQVQVLSSNCTLYDSHTDENEA
jgi:hypothetical protein